MALMSNCPKVRVGRIFAHLASFALMLLGFALLLVFVGPVYIESDFQYEAQMIKGFGLFCILSGGYIALSLASEGVNARELYDLRVLKGLCALGMIFGAVMMA